MHARTAFTSGALTALLALAGCSSAQVPVASSPGATSSQTGGHGPTEPNAATGSATTSPATTATTPTSTPTTTATTATATPHSTSGSQHPTATSSTQPTETSSATTHPTTPSSSVPVPSGPDGTLGSAWGTKPQPWMIGKDLERIPTSKKLVALTIDAGANADAIDSILATLAAKKVHATFFLTGTWARTYPAKVRAIVAAGHVVGNHSTTHPKFSTLTAAQIDSQLSTADATISALAGRTTRPLFRFPFGDRDAASLAEVNRQGYVAVRWTVDTLGWSGTSGSFHMTADKVVSRVLAHLEPGEIVLMHTGSHPTDHSTLDADALPRVIDELRARGYGFTTLAVLTR